MDNIYPITAEQKAVLEAFTCERLSENAENLELIQYFESSRGEGLVKNLKERGVVADQKGKIAYYVIKNPRGEIVLFFSLKCGVLFDRDDLVRFMEYFQDEEIQDLWRRYKAGDQSAMEFFGYISERYGQEEYKSLIHNLKSFDSIKRDKRKEPNRKIIRVFESHPAVELVDFCANDVTKHCWHAYGMAPRRMGEVLFWWFIVPKMQEIGRLIGSEYAFLFAADETPDGFLVRYYEDAFHFRKLTKLGTIKPFYDMNCYFMGKRLRSIRGGYPDNAELRIDDDIRGLDYYREDFFRHFNIRTDAGDFA